MKLIEIIKSNENKIEHNSFYKEFTERNGSFINSTIQEEIRKLVFLIAGCGSTGGATIEPLARIGVENFILVDNGKYELNNLNRQSANLSDINQNKAIVQRDRIKKINPFSKIKTIEEGISTSNVESCIKESNIIIDGIDVTEESGWLAKWLLHVNARNHKKLVITGWDIGPSQYIQIFDYSKIKKPFNGAIKESDVYKKAPFSLMRKALPINQIPQEMLTELALNWNKFNYSIPQVVYTSMLFGAIVPRLVVDYINNKPLRKNISVNLQTLTTTNLSSFSLRIKSLPIIIKLLRELKKKQ